MANLLSALKSLRQIWTSKETTFQPFQVKKMEADFGSRRQKEINDHFSIELMPEENLVLSIKEQMENLSLSGSICRVPGELSKGDEEGYFPRLVSIGPLHHGNETLKAMEDLKWRYLNALLNRKSAIESTLDVCIKILRNLEQKARKCYKENINMGSNEFLQMMLVDGCFIIELFLKFAIKDLRRRDDPCFTKYELLFMLRCDMILLENQIPFFVLRQLFHHVTIPKQSCRSLNELALYFFRKFIPGDVQIPKGKFGPDIHHLLDLIRQCHLPTMPEVQSQWTQKYFPSAVQLKAAGIKFSNANAESMLNIRFDDGELKIPSLKIQKHTEVLFRNLVALEYCCYESSKHIISYIFLMEQLIKSKEDVRILHRRRILIHDPKKQEEIISLFKKLYVDINIEVFYYKWLCEKVDGHVKIKGQARTNWCQKMKLYKDRGYLKNLLSKIHH